MCRAALPRKSLIWWQQIIVIKTKSNASRTKRSLLLFSFYPLRHKSLMAKQVRFKTNKQTIKTFSSTGFNWYYCTSVCFVGFFPLYHLTERNFPYLRLMSWIEFTVSGSFLIFFPGNERLRCDRCFSKLEPELLAKNQKRLESIETLRGAGMSSTLICI